MSKPLALFRSVPTRRGGEPGTCGRHGPNLSWARLSVCSILSQRLPMAGTNKTVLLVEDNEDNLVIYYTILRHAGFEVIDARDGEAGIATAKAKHPGLILMDVSIPLVDGWEATRRIK